MNKKMILAICILAGILTCRGCEWMHDQLKAHEVIGKIVEVRWQCKTYDNLANCFSDRTAANCHRLLYMRGGHDRNFLCGSTGDFRNEFSEVWVDITVQTQFGLRYIYLHHFPYSLPPTGSDVKIRTAKGISEASLIYK